MNQPDSTPAKYGVIESGIPIPADMRGRKPFYPIDAMKVGDSIVIPRDRNRIYPLLNTWKKKFGFKFTCSAIGIGETRVWRTA